MYVKQSLFEAEKEAKEFSIKNPNIVYYVIDKFKFGFFIFKNFFKKGIDKRNLICYIMFTKINVRFTRWFRNAEFLWK